MRKLLLLTLAFLVALSISLLPGTGAREHAAVSVLRGLPVAPAGLDVRDDVAQAVGATPGSLARPFDLPAGEGAIAVLAADRLAADEPVQIGRLTLFVLAGGLLLCSGGVFATRRLLPVTR